MKQNLVVPLLALFIGIVSTVLIVLSTSKLSQTHDEAGHIAAGLEWMQGTYHLSPQNPPLSRVGAAIGPYLQGVRIEIPAGFYENYWSFGGASSLAQKPMKATGDYRYQLQLARLGVIPFFMASLVLVFLLGKHITGPIAGSISVIILATTAVVMAHAGLATTDVPSMTTYLLAIYLLIVWIEKPTRIRSCWLGVGIAVAVCTKFTAIAFIAPAVILFYLLGMKKNQTTASFGFYSKQFGIAVALSLVATWAIYQFSFGDVSAIPHDDFIGVQDCYKDDPLASMVASWTVPAPEFFKGILDNWCANQKPLAGYLFEEIKPTGTWMFYPVAFLFKTSLSMLFLFGASIFLLIKFKLYDWRIVGICGTIVMIFSLSLFSHQNIGIRHIIHVYPLVALLLGTILTLTLHKLKSKKQVMFSTVVGLLLLYQIAGAYSSWPYMLSYFNPMAGNEPGEIIVDSDLYWGQGMYELEAYFEYKDVDSLTIAIFHCYDFCEYKLPPVKFLYPEDRAKGWIAIDEFTYRKIPNWIMDDPCNGGSYSLFDTPFDQRYEWLREYEPVARVGGNAIRIYFIE